MSPSLYFGPWSSFRLEDVPNPRLHGDDWVLVRTRLAGICGSDTKQVFLRGDRDNPLTALVSFPHILGHEATGIVEQTGSAGRRVAPGQRVVLNPWLSCAPRGINPVCRACARGDYQLCDRFTEGRLSPGIHLGNCTTAGGAFAPYFAAHESQLLPVPPDISDEHAVLADPCSVQLHAVLRHPPDAGEPVLVYGCGTLGLATIAILRLLHPATPVWAVARHGHQAAAARAAGAVEILDSRPQMLVEEVARLAGSRPLRPWSGAAWLMRGVGTIYDTVGSPETIETAIRLASPRGRIVVSGVEAPRRFEWTPYYFKELTLAGSNAFAMETFEGQRRHAMEIYFDLVRRGLDLSALITHRFALAAYQRAFMATRAHERSRAIKAVFAF
ncbi:MAG TPA: alcohol dehydrogenase catalytic domain-containing protein [Dehalococcoidia bacterium]|nr:alcohol dehydrogenase catalytic domain-containing protein [Dehalococcoidia bacterium]